jgi:hypothetical protein
VIAAYRWLQGGAADLGMGRRRGETLREYGARLVREADVPPDPLERLTTLTVGAAYSMREPATQHSDEAVAAARGLLRELRSRAGIGKTVLGALRPGD